MVEIVFYNKNERAVGYKINGHIDADLDDNARLVCGVISCVSQMVANNLSEYYDANIDKFETGILEVSFDLPTTNPILVLLKDAMESLKEEYPKDIEIKNEIR